MKWILVFLWIAPLCAERIEEICVTNRNEAFVSLSDGTKWQVSAFQRRDRGLFEWMRDDDLGVPEAFVTELADWKAGKEVAVCIKPLVDDMSAANAKEIRAASHLMVDAGTGKALFGLPVLTEDCFKKLFKAGRSEGFSRGYDIGSSDGCKKGFKEGYDKGSTETYSKAYHSGFTDGYKAGFQAQGEAKAQNPPPYPGR